MGSNAMGVNNFFEGLGIGTDPLGGFVVNRNGVFHNGVPFVDTPDENNSVLKNSNDTFDKIVTSKNGTIATAEEEGTPFKDTLEKKDYKELYDQLEVVLNKPGSVLKDVWTRAKDYGYNPGPVDPEDRTGFKSKRQEWEDKGVVINSLLANSANLRQYISADNGLYKKFAENESSNSPGARELKNVVETVLYANPDIKVTMRDKNGKVVKEGRKYLKEKITTSNYKKYLNDPTFKALLIKELEKRQTDNNTRLNRKNLKKKEVWGFGHIADMGWTGALTAPILLHTGKYVINGVTCGYAGKTVRAIGSKFVTQNFAKRMSHQLTVTAWQGAKNSIVKQLAKKGMEQAAIKTVMQGGVKKILTEVGKKGILRAAGRFTFQTALRGALLASAPATFGLSLGLFVLSEAIFGGIEYATTGKWSGGIVGDVGRLAGAMVKPVSGLWSHDEKVA